MKGHNDNTTRVVIFIQWNWAKVAIKVDTFHFFFHVIADD